MADTGSQAENRTTRRFAMRLPVSVKFANGDLHEVEGHTKDVSYRGVFFYADAHLIPGSEIEFVLTLPPEVTLADNIRVRCRGRVLRLDEDVPGNRVGVAAVIDKYEFLTPASSSSPAE